jgi:hypothetical protein
MFQKTVATIAIIILIITLCIIGVALYRAKYHSEYPPVIPNCPDYWDASGNLDISNNFLCVNTMNLGSSGTPKTMNFSTSSWKGNNGLCLKYKWAKTQNLTWDGITDNADICGM